MQTAPRIIAIDALPYGSVNRKVFFQSKNQRRIQVDISRKTKAIGALCLALNLFVPASAQDAPPAPSVPEAPVFGWSRQFTGMLNLNQVYFRNWVKGGTDALAWELNLGGTTALEQEDFRWETNARILYGQTKLADLDSRKSSDEWKLETVYTRKLGTWINPFAAATGWSQFTAGYDYDDDAGTRTQTSDFFDPAYFTQTLGLGFTPFPDFKERLGFALKETFSADYGYADDVETTDKVEDFKLEYGLSSITEYQLTLMENILGTTKLDVFVNFQGIDEIDARWENKITAKVNKNISVNLELELLYDKDLSESTQLRESLAVGITFLSL